MKYYNNQYKEDLLYEELELTELSKIEELDNIDLDSYFEDYRDFDRDLTDLIKEGK